MKRILSLILALILCLSLFTVAAADGDDGESECQHVWKTDAANSKAATCIQDGVKAEYCTECGITKTTTISKTGHIPKDSWSIDEYGHWYDCKGCGEEINGTFVEHTYQWAKDDSKHWQVCTVCGYTLESSKAAHKWDGGKVTKQPTCVAKGTKVYTCSVCGATKTETLPMTEHSWDGGKTTIQPTITEKGESTFKCIVCGKVATREIDPLGLSMTPEELLTVRTMTGNALDGRLDDENWVILQGVTTEEEYARIQGGWPITVTLKVTDVTSTIGEKVMQEVQNVAGKQKIYCFLNMELTKEMYLDPPIPVNETTEPVILALTLPEEIQEATSKRKERGFTVYRIDGEKAEKVAAQLSEDGQSLRLQTNTFGTYALTYHDTGRGNFDPMLLLYGAVGLVTLGGIGFLVYKLFFASRREEYDDDDDE